jgi:beta-barrel assembly-enhancing protease
MTAVRRWSGVAIACVTAGTLASALSLISVSDEIALGRQAQKQVRSQVPELKDREVVNYVQAIGRKLVAKAGGPKYPYSFSVANYREINAFALPGGPVWIHRGTLAAAQNEAQVAAVLAHEVAHVAERHAANQLTKGLVANGLLGLLGAMLGNDSSARAAQIAAQLMAGGYMLKFSRDDEREADRVGARIMRQAGWDAREMIAFMDILDRQQGRNPGSVDVFLSSHPAPTERAALLRTALKGTSGGRRDSDQFHAIRQRLSTLPGVRSMPRQ